MTLFKKLILFCLTPILIGSLYCCSVYLSKPTRDIDPIYYKSAAELANAIQRGEITSLELLNIFLDRIQRYNKDINAVVALNTGAARARAKEADMALAKGQYWGPLHGVPMTVKDVFEVAGIPTTSGDPVLKD